MQQQRYTAAAQFKHKIELYHSRSAASLHSVPAQLQVLQTAQTQVSLHLLLLAIMQPAYSRWCAMHCSSGERSQTSYRVTCMEKNVQAQLAHNANCPEQSKIWLL